MARNRIVKPEFFTSEKLSNISILANLFFIGILIHCDDYGVCINNNRRLIGDIFPLRESLSEKDIEQAKCELLKIGVLISVEKEEKRYLIVKNWQEHQKVEKPSKRRFLNDCEIEYLLKTLPDTVPETLPDTVEKFSETLPAPMLINNVSVNSNGNGNENVSLSDSPTKKTIFVKPTESECLNYFSEKGQAGIEANKFFNYYESNGWMVGKNKMKNWKAAASNWISNIKHTNQSNKKYEFEKEAEGKYDNI